MRTEDSVPPSASRLVAARLCSTCCVLASAQCVYQVLAVCLLGEGSQQSYSGLPPLITSHVYSLGMRKKEKSSEKYCFTQFYSFASTISPARVKPSQLKENKIRKLCHSLIFPDFYSLIFTIR